MGEKIWQNNGQLECQFLELLETENAALMDPGAGMVAPRITWQLELEGETWKGNSIQEPSDKP